MSESSQLAPLDAVGWLAQQPPEFRGWAAAVGRWRRYVRGQVLYVAGDPSDGLYGLADGAFDITFPWWPRSRSRSIARRSASGSAKARCWRTSRAP